MISGRVLVTSNLRIAEETNFPFRLVEREDLVSGTEVWVVNLKRTRGGEVNPLTWPETKVVRLDDDPVRNGVLYFHSRKPRGEEQLTETVERVLADPDPNGPGDGPDMRYWIPIDLPPEPEEED